MKEERARREAGERAEEAEEEEEEEEERVPEVVGGEAEAVLEAEKVEEVEMVAEVERGAPRLALGTFEDWFRWRRRGDAALRGVVAQKRIEGPPRGGHWPAGPDVAATWR